MNSVMKITIINANTRTQLVIDNIIPDSIKDTYSANFSEKEIIGRSSPLLIYNGGSTRQCSFTIVMHEDLLTDGSTILQWGDKVKSMSFPVYSNGVRPPKVYCRFGKVFAFWGTLNTDLTYKGPIRDEHYVMAEATFTFTRIASIKQDNSENEELPLSASDIISKGYDR